MSLRRYSWVLAFLASLVCLYLGFYWGKDHWSALPNRITSALLIIVALVLAGAFDNPSGDGDMAP